MRSRNQRRWWLAGAAIGALASVPLAACSDDGITPDCSSPDAGCGPDLSATSEAGDAEASVADVQTSDVVIVSDTGVGDASSDADAHD